MNRGTATFSNVAKTGPNTDANAEVILFRVACPSAVDSNDLFNNRNTPTIAPITATTGFANRSLNASPTPLIAPPACPAAPGKADNWSSNCLDWN